MAIPKLSKMVADCERKYARVAAFVNVHRQTLLDAFGQAIRPGLEHGEPAFDPAAWLDGFFRRLRQSFAELLDAEERHLDELAGDAHHRDERNEAAADLRTRLIDLRNLFRANFGKEKTEEAGFPRRLRPEPLTLLRQVGRILRRLFDEGFDLPAARFASEQASRSKAVEVLVPAARRLRRAVDLAAHEQCKARVTRAAKNEAMKRFGVAHRATVDLLDGICRFAGRSDLMPLLREPSPRRSEKPGSAPS
jgi:hypothetical protein